MDTPYTEHIYTCKPIVQYTPIKYVNVNHIENIHISQDQPWKYLANEYIQCIYSIYSMYNEFIMLYLYAIVVCIYSYTYNIILIYYIP
jgi:hypothetical protein